MYMMVAMIITMLLLVCAYDKQIGNEKQKKAKDDFEGMFLLNDLLKEDNGDQKKQ